MTTTATQTPIKIDFTATTMLRRSAAGHYTRTGHVAVGYYVRSETQGIVRTVMTCCGQKIEETKRATAALWANRWQARCTGCEGWQGAYEVSRNPAQKAADRHNTLHHPEATA